MAVFTPAQASDLPADLLDSLGRARRFVALTGAGISAESGLPTFRENLTGLWERFDPTELATAEAFARDPELVWGWYEWRRSGIARAQPNAGHRALARMETLVPHFTLVTQNVDDLHERAGSRLPLHLHGEMTRPFCFVCGMPHALDPTPPNEPEGGRHVPPPACTTCGRPVRPGVVWFGESLPVEPYEAALRATHDAHCFLCIGTSSLVYPAAGLPQIARRRDATLVIVNPAQTPTDELAQYVLRGSASTILPWLADALAAPA
jgi:NAD-dependent deacetylase